MAKSIALLLLLVLNIVFISTSNGSLLNKAFKRQILYGGSIGQITRPQYYPNQYGQYEAANDRNNYYFYGQGKKI